MEQEQTHFEIMEQLGQISIFDVMPPVEEIQEIHIAVGDKVRCNITEESDEEAYYYFKYYYPTVLKGTGEVVQVVQDVMHVRFGTDTVLLKPHEVEV